MERFGFSHFVWHITPFDPIGVAVHIECSLVFGLVFGRFFEISGILSQYPCTLSDRHRWLRCCIQPATEPMQVSIQVLQAISFIVGIISLALLAKHLLAEYRREGKLIYQKHPYNIYRDVYRDPIGMV